MKDMFNKRFWLFAGDFYYPSGGMRDFIGSFDTVAEALSAAVKYDWHQVFDSVGKYLTRVGKYLTRVDEGE